MASFEVEPEVRAQAQAEPPKKSMVDKMRRASMAAYLAETSGVNPTTRSNSEKEREGITRQEAWSNMVLALVGVMVCYLPGIMYKAGWLLTPPLLLLSALVVVRMGDLICQACELAEQAQGAEAGSIKSYEELATVIGVFKVLLVTKNTVLIATLLLQETFLTSAVEGLIPFDVSKSLVRWLVIFPAFCVMALLKDLAQLSKYSWVGLVGMGMQLVGLLVGCLLGCFQEMDRGYSMMPTDGTLTGMTGITLSAFIFSFAILATVPSVRSQMKKPEEMALALRDSILFTVVLYEIIMIWGYAAYGQKLKENLIETISAIFPLFGMLPCLGALANVAMTAPLFFYCFFSAIEATGNDALRTQGTPLNMAARVTLVILLTFVGWAIPELLAIIGVFSSVFCVCNNLWFPLIFFHKLRRQAQRPAPVLGIVLDVAIGILGVLVFIYGLKGSVETLMKDFGFTEKEENSNMTTTAAMLYW